MHVSPCPPECVLYIFLIFRAILSFPTCLASGFHVVKRELIKANYVKEIDSLTGEPKYRNRRTGHVSRRKPIFLGSDDLETAR